RSSTAAAGAWPDTVSPPSSMVSSVVEAVPTGRSSFAAPPLIRAKAGPPGCSERSVMSAVPRHCLISKEQATGAPSSTRSGSGISGASEAGAGAGGAGAGGDAGTDVDGNTGADAGRTGGAGEGVAQPDISSAERAN